MAKALLAAVAAAAVAVVSVAWAQSDLDGLYAQLDEIKARYGFAPAPDLTEAQWDEYRAEVQEIYDAHESDFASVEAMYSEYHKITESIGRIDMRVEAVNARYGFEPLPKMDGAQWEEYHAEALKIQEEADEYWKEYDRVLESDPGAAPDQARIKEIDAKMAAVNSAYGIAEMPELGSDQMERREADLSALEAEKEPYFEELDRLQAAYRGSLDGVEQATRLLQAVDEKYGIDSSMPELDAQEFESYEAEIRAVQSKIDEIEAAMDAAYRDALSDMGVTLPSGDDPDFDGDLARLASEHPQIARLGGPGTDKGEVYEYLEGIAPQIREVFERHGYEFGVSSAAQFERLDALISRSGGPL